MTPPPIVCGGAGGVVTFLLFSPILLIFSVTNMPRKRLHLLIRHHKQWGTSCKNGEQTLPLNVWTLAYIPYICFCKPTHKIKSGITNRWGTTNNKSPRPIIMMG